MENCKLSIMKNVEPTTVEKAKYVLEDYYGIDATITTYNNKQSLFVSSWNDELTDSIDVYMDKEQINYFALIYDKKKVLKNMEKGKFFARKCDYTGKGINDGYVFIDDSCMINDRQLLIKELRKDRQAVIDLLPKNTSHMKKYENCEYMSNTELKELYNKIHKARNNKETDEELCDIAYAVGYYYFTEWEDKTEYNYEEVDGKLIDREWV